jgi:tripartite-type tricarboxylate transporter receptor subunit TctC
VPGSIGALAQRGVVVNASPRRRGRRSVAIAGGDDRIPFGGAARYPKLERIPPGYEATDWKGMFAPKNTPPEIIDKLNKEINAGLADPKLRARFAELISPVMPGSPADFGQFIAKETEKWAKVVKFAGIKAD